MTPQSRATAPHTSRCATASRCPESSRARGHFHHGLDAPAPCHGSRWRHDCVRPLMGDYGMGVYPPCVRVDLQSGLRALSRIRLPTSPERGRSPGDHTVTRRRGGDAGRFAVLRRAIRAHRRAKEVTDGRSRDVMRHLLPVADSAIFCFDDSTYIYASRLPRPCRWISRAITFSRHGDICATSLRRYARRIPPPISRRFRPCHRHTALPPGHAPAHFRGAIALASPLRLIDVGFFSQQGARR